MAKIDRCQRFDPGSIPGNRTSLKFLNQKFVFIAQSGERTTEDRKVRCSIHLGDNFYLDR